MKRIALIFFVAVILPLALAGWAYRRAPARMRPAEAELKSQWEVIEHLEIPTGSALDGLKQLCSALGLRLEVMGKATQDFAGRRMTGPIVLNHVSRRAVLAVVPQFLVGGRQAAVVEEGVLYVGSIPDVRPPANGPVVSRVVDVALLLKRAKAFTDEADGLVMRLYGHAPNSAMPSNHVRGGYYTGGRYVASESAEHFLPRTFLFDVHPCRATRPVSLRIVGDRLIVVAAAQDCRRVENIFGRLTAPSANPQRWPCGAELEGQTDAQLEQLRTKTGMQLLPGPHRDADGRGCNWLVEENLAAPLTDRYTDIHYTRIYDVRDLILQRIANSSRPESTPAADANPATETGAALDLYASWQLDQRIMFGHYIGGQWVVQARLADHARIERMLLDLRRNLNGTTPHP
ncbi:MAG: hypothetical protein ACHRHE_13240 [Tepidisphaerales bacterium]